MNFGMGLLEKNMYSHDLLISHSVNHHLSLKDRNNTSPNFLFIAYFWTRPVWGGYFLLYYIGWIVIY